MTECVCPVCAARFCWAAASSDVSARACFGLLGRFPAGVAALMPAYIGMFRQRSGALAWPVVRTLLIDLSERDGEKMRAQPAAWARALAKVLQRQTGEDFVLPLTSHAYLRSVVAREAPAPVYAAPVAAAETGTVRMVAPAPIDPTFERQAFIERFKGREHLLEPGEIDDESTLDDVVSGMQVDP